MSPDRLSLWIGGGDGLPLLMRHDSQTETKQPQLLREKIYVEKNHEPV